MPEQRLCLDPDRIGRRCQLQGSLRPVDHLRAPQPSRPRAGPTAGRPPRAIDASPASSACLPGCTEQALGLDGLARARRRGSRARRCATVRERTATASRAKASAWIRSPAPIMASTALSSRCSRCRRSGLSRLPSTRAQAAPAQAPTADSSSSEGVEIGDESGIRAGSTAMTRCRSAEASSSTSPAAPECSRTRRAGPSCSYTAACTSGWLKRDAPDPGVVASLQQVEVDRLVEGLDRVGHLRERRGRGQRRRSPRARRWPRPAAVPPGYRRPACRRTLHGERAGSRQHRLPGAPAVPSGISEQQSGDVERIPLGVRVQPLARPWPTAGATPRAVARLVISSAGQGGEPDGRSRPSGRHPAQALRKSGRGLAALREQGQHPLPDQATRPRTAARAASRRRPSGRRRSTITTGAFCSRSSMTSRIRAPTPTGSSARQRQFPTRQQARVAHAGHPHQLVDHAEGDERLPLLTGGPQHRQLGLLGQEAGRATADLPIPAGPSTRTRRGRPARTVASSALSTAISECRPTKGWALSGRFTAHLLGAGEVLGHQTTSARFSAVAGGSP